MVGVAFGAQLVAGGLGFYALPRLLVPLAEQFSQGDRAGVAMLGAAMSLSGILIGPLVGRSLTRFPLRTVMPMGALSFALGFVAAAYVDELWQLMLVYATTVPLAISALGAVGANALVGNWFVRRRSMALGVAQFGMSIAGALMTFFISWTLLQGGWRGTYLWFAGLATLAALLLRLTITDRPADRGEQPDGDPAPLTVGPGPSLPTLSFGEALRDPKLWLVGMVAGVAFSGTTGVVQNAHALVTDAGYPVPRADTALAVISLGAALGKLLFGALGLRLAERSNFALALLGQAAMLALLPFCLGHYAALLAAGFLFGLNLGGVMPTMSALLARIYGSEGFGPVMGYLAPMLVPFQMVGAPIAAAVRDSLGSYELAIFGFAFTTAAATLALFALRLPEDSPSPAPA